MKITAYTSGFAHNGIEHCAFAVRLESDGQIWEKLVPLKGYTINQAEIISAIYACQSININHNEIDIEFIVSNNYLTSITNIKDGKWTADPKSNKEHVDSLRELLLKFKSFFIKLDPTDVKASSVKQRARIFHDKK